MGRTVHPIVIAGGGPVGLTLSALLSRRGVKNVVVERSRRLTEHPQVGGGVSTSCGCGAGGEALASFPLVSMPSPQLSCGLRIPGHNTAFFRLEQVSTILHTTTSPNASSGALHQLSHHGGFPPRLHAQALLGDPG
jgi:hypothetical protein